MKIEQLHVFLNIHVRFQTNFQTHIYEIFQKSFLGYLALLHKIFIEYGITHKRVQNIVLGLLKNVKFLLIL